MKKKREEMAEGNRGIRKKSEKRNSKSLRGVRRRFPALLVCLLAVIGSLTACGGGTKVVFTTGFGKDEVFRIADENCTRAEIMVYLTTTQNRYESVYGPEVWNIAKDGVTLEENVKETVLAKIAQIKTMCLLAEKEGVELDETESGLAADAAAEYYSSLSADRIEQLGVDEKTVLRLYTEYALANKVYEYIIQDINPEISDDEARTIAVQHIFLRTWTTDGSGARVRYSEDVKQSVYEKACGIREQAVSGEKDFLELASKYSEDPNITCSFGKGEMEEAFEEEAFSLETDEISPVIETDSGYHIIKCISTFDREQTELSKQEIVEQRRREVFGEEYDAFALTLVRQLNTKLWDEITLVQGGSVDTVDFFEIYAKFFPQ